MDGLQRARLEAVRKICEDTKRMAEEAKRGDNPFLTAQSAMAAANAELVTILADLIEDHLKDHAGMQRAAKAAEIGGSDGLR